MSGGEFYIGGGSETQKAAGFDDTIDDFRAYLTMASGPGVDQPRVDRYAENGLEHLEWLAKQGVPFKGTYLPGRWPEPPTDDTLIWCGSETHGRSVMWRNRRRAATPLRPWAAAAARW